MLGAAVPFRRSRPGSEPFAGLSAAAVDRRFGSDGPWPKRDVWLDGTRRRGITPDDLETARGT
jgi:hypothetical protein